MKCSHKLERNIKVKLNSMQQTKGSDRFSDDLRRKNMEIKVQFSNGTSSKSSSYTNGCKW